MANYVIASQPPIGEPRRRRSFNIGNWVPHFEVIFCNWFVCGIFHLVLIFFPSWIWRSYSMYGVSVLIYVGKKALSNWRIFQASTVKGKGKTEALRAEREAQDGDQNEDWFFSDDVGSSNSGYYVLQVWVLFLRMFQRYWLLLS